MAKKLTDAEFAQALKEAGGSVSAMSRATGLSARGIHARKVAVEGRGIPITQAPTVAAPVWAYHRSRDLRLDDGVVVVYSDAHYWPGEPPTAAFRALVKLCGAMKPDVIVANGDLIDGAKISRFPAAGWAKLPSMTAELDEMQNRQAEIVKAAPKAKLFRTIGNHDLRLDRFFASNAEQFEGLPGTRLADFLPDWPESYTVRVNPGTTGDTVIKHRFRGGIHAGWNNVLHAGTSIVTGHLHTLEAKPLRGYRDARAWGVETGTLANHPAELPDEGAGAFEYLEDNPVNWACGFAILTYYKGRLLQPEFCSVEFGKAWFRGKEV